MATWLTHLRVADLLADRIKISSRGMFYAGSIAPDTDLPPDVTHRCRSGDKAACDARGFYKLYLRNAGGTADDDFYLGYYIHLLTDIIWHRERIEPLNKLDKASVKTVKESWKRVDTEFLLLHRDFRPFTAMRTVLPFICPRLDYDDAGRISRLLEQNLSSRETIHASIAVADTNTAEEIARFVADAADAIYSQLTVPGGW